MSTARIEEAVCAHICEREPSNPATYFDLIGVALAWQPSMTALELDEMLTRMLKAGKIEMFEDEERGTVYVRDC